MNNKFIRAISKLGEILRNEDNYSTKSGGHTEITNTIAQAKNLNPWFVKDNVKYALKSIGDTLTMEKIYQWLELYKEKIPSKNSPWTIGVVMAGNIPLVGFHDFLCVIMSGNKFLGKLSSDDTKLLPVLAEMLINLEPEIKEYIDFTKDKLTGFDAIIATGSNNTARYFDYYFGKYPNIIRKNRNGVAVLTGNESPDELKNLGVDIFMYFGMGCRSVSKIYVPEGYDFTVLLNALESFMNVGNHHKYKNNYDYYRSIFLINKVGHYDNGFLLITEDMSYASPPSVIYFEKYQTIESVGLRLKNDRDLIQCIVSNAEISNKTGTFGSAQQPSLWDYADGVDTMEFLVGL